MGKEIERKFLVANDSWRNKVTKQYRIQQGYLNTDPIRTVRVRIIGEQGFLTVKGKSEGLTRLEFEYQIPAPDALAMLKLCDKNSISKTRFEVEEHSMLWEIDVFDDLNKGLELAEVELDSEEQSIILPEWVGEEVSYDTKYYNSNLIMYPFVAWT